MDIIATQADADDLAETLSRRTEQLREEIRAYLLEAYRLGEHIGTNHDIDAIGMAAAAAGFDRATAAIAAFVEVGFPRHLVAAYLLALAAQAGALIMGAAIDGPGTADKPGPFGVLPPEFAEAGEAACKACDRVIDLYRAFAARTTRQ